MAVGQELPLGLHVGFYHVLHHCQSSILYHLYHLYHVYQLCSSNPYIKQQLIAHQVMESFDMFLSGNFVALTAFKERYGVYVEGSGNTIETKWQSALFQAGQCGAFVGVFLAGPITNRLGYRWTTILGLVLMNATIFVSFFVSKTPVARSRLKLMIHPGRFTRRPDGWTSIGRCPVGIVHRKLPCLRL